MSSTIYERLQIIGCLPYPHLTHTHPPFMSPASRRYTATLAPAISELFEIEAAITRTAVAHFGPGVQYRSPLRYRERLFSGCWCITATNPDIPVFRDENGMPERADAFFAEQSVEMDMQFFAYEGDGRQPHVLGVGAHLKGLRLVGGAIRSSN